MTDPSAGPITYSTLPEDDDTDDDVVTYFTLPEDDDADDDSGQHGHAHDDSGRQGHAAGAATVRFVQIRWSPAPGRDRTWVLERTVVRGIHGSDVSDLTEDTVADYMAQKISDPVFAYTDRWWIVSDPGGVGAAAGAVESARQGMHKLLLGNPAQAVCEKLGVPFPDIAGGVAAQIPLPIDAPFGFIKQLLQVAGMAVGMLAGFPVLTTACCKSFLHDQITRRVARGIRQVVLDPIMRGVPTRQPVAPPAAPPESADPGRRPAWPGVPARLRVPAAKSTLGSPAVPARTGVPATLGVPAKSTLGSPAVPARPGVPTRQPVAPPAAPPESADPGRRPAPPAVPATRRVSARTGRPPRATRGR